MKFLEAARELKEVLKSQPKSVEIELVNAARDHLGYYEDSTFGENFKNLKEAKEQALEEAIVDISGGGDLLKSGQIGVVFVRDHFEKFYSLHGETPEGTITFSIFLKKFKAFQNFRETEGDDLDQDLINVVTYSLIVYWARL